MRVSKTVRLGNKLRIQGNLDAYNILNGNYVTAINTQYGPQWLKPLNVLNGRLSLRYPNRRAPINTPPHRRRSLPNKAMPAVLLIWRLIHMRSVYDDAVSG